MGDAGTYVCRADDNQVTAHKVNVLNSECTHFFCSFHLLFGLGCLVSEIEVCLLGPISFMGRVSDSGFVCVCLSVFPAIPA